MRLPGPLRSRPGNCLSFDDLRTEVMQAAHMDGSDSDGGFAAFLKNSHDDTEDDA